MGRSNQRFMVVLFGLFLTVDLKLRHPSCKVSRNTLMINFIEQNLPEVQGHVERTQEENIVRLIFHNEKVQIKVDVNHILRGYN